MRCETLAGFGPKFFCYSPTESQGTCCLSWLHERLPVPQVPLAHLREVAELQPGVTCPWKGLPECDQKVRLRRKGGCWKK